MKREKLQPVIVKLRAKQQAFVLIHRGYVQATETVDCPVCSLRFLLLFDSKDRNKPGSRPTVIHLEAVDYFLSKVNEDHRKGHLHDKFGMPGFIHQRDPETNMVESCCVFCGHQIGANHEEAKLTHAENIHNCSLSALRSSPFS